MIVKHQEIRNEQLKNQTVNGISVKAFLIGQQNTFGSSQIDFSQALLKVILLRKGIPHVICQDNLLVLGLASTIDTASQSAFAAKNSRDVILQNSNAYMVSFIVPFGGHLNLSGDDELIIECQNMPTLFAQQSMQQASYLEIKAVKSVGYEKFVPKIQSLVIQKNELSEQYPLGSNLIRLVLVNIDMQDFNSQVVDDLIFSSDRLNESYTFADLVTNKLARYGKALVNPAITDEAAEFEQDQSFVLSDFHQHFDDVNLQIKFNSPNVNQSKNFLVAWTYSTDWTILQKAADSQAKHQQQAAAKVGK